MRVPGLRTLPGRSAVAAASEHLRELAHHRLALLGVEGHGRDHQRPDARVAIDSQPLGDLVARADERRRVDQLVGQRRRGLLLLAVEVEVLDLVGRVPEPVAPHQGVVEVLLARAHPAHVQREEWPHGVAGAIDVVVDADLHAWRDLEAVERAAGARRSLLEQLLGVADVLGGEEQRHPAVGDLAGELGVLRPDRGDVDRDLLLHRRDRQLQGLARPVGQRQRVDLAVVLEPFPRERLAQDLDVLARALQLLWEALAVPALGHLGAGGAEAEDHPAVGELIEGGGGHRRHRRGARRHLEDRRAEFDLLGLRCDPGEHGRGVRAVGLRGPDRVEPGRLRLLYELDLLAGGQPEAPVANAYAQLHAANLLSPLAYEASGRYLTGMRRRRPAHELRIAIDCLPLDARKAMLEGVRANRIIVGAYV